MANRPFQFGIGDLFLLTTTAAVILALLYYFPLTLMDVASYAMHVLDEVLCLATFVLVVYICGWLTGGFRQPSKRPPQLRD